ncbi:MAG: energy-coupling factor transporter transmembrane protein EcfT [Ruminococcaceae bacterium]|jgi:energy-coupling factor transport system permease protein|nr:energy-coupling factor transporter transmembrane protein EcfT [Oscillospiraceae bacterium]
MLKQVSLGRYYPGTSVLHRLDPRVKIILSFLYMVIIFLAQSLIPMLLVALTTVVLILLSRVPLRHIMNSLKPILFILIFAFVINLLTIQGDQLLKIGPVIISEQGLYTAIRMALRLAFLIISTTLFLTLTTTPILVSDAIEQLLKPLSRIGFPAHEMAMMMSIALRFVPTLLEETEKIMKAQSSRGADYDTGGLIAKARGLVSVLIPLFVSAFKRAEELAVAMEARCYRGGEGRTRLKIMRCERKDALFVVSMSSVFLTILLTQYLL